jgi:hypothetical protein
MRPNNNDPIGLIKYDVTTIANVSRNLASPSGKRFWDSTGASIIARIKSYHSINVPIEVERITNDNLLLLTGSSMRIAEIVELEELLM